MGMVDSLRVLAEVARVTVPSAVDVAFGRLERASVDERARQFARRVVELLDVRLTVDGQDNVSPSIAYVYMSNYQSHLDIPILYAALPARALRMVAMAELFRFPGWGPALRRAEFIEMDRSSREQAVLAIQSTAALVRDGVSVWIAPEESRSRNGMVGPLRRGGFHLALGTGASIVPVAIRGSIDLIARGTMRRGVPVHVTIGAPLSTLRHSVPELMALVGSFLHRHVEVN
jgi:1-acyl-sn-glycerol-3-phosphate acyltransferase